MNGLHASTFLLQWAIGGLAFLWVTTRRREVGLGYGWLMRATYALFALGALIFGQRDGFVAARDLTSALVVLTATLALAVSVQRKSAGVALQRERVQVRSKKVSEMTGIDRAEQRFDSGAAEFPPILDLVPACIGTLGLIATGIAIGDPAWLTVLRLLSGAAFLGAVTDAMLLGHWYLVQPGLPRAPLLELVRLTTLAWPIEVTLWLIPTGMISVLNGTIDDGYAGILGWTWITCALTTLGLLLVTRAALKERQYSAVMAATGLLYLAILTAFGLDLIAQALL